MQQGLSIFLSQASLDELVFLPELVLSFLMRYGFGALHSTHAKVSISSDAFAASMRLRS